MLFWYLVNVANFIGAKMDEWRIWNKDRWQIWRKPFPANCMEYDNR